MDRCGSSASERETVRPTGVNHRGCSGPSAERGHDPCNENITTTPRALFPAPVFTHGLPLRLWRCGRGDARDDGVRGRGKLSGELGYYHADEVWCFARVVVGGRAVVSVGRWGTRGGWATAARAWRNHRERVPEQAGAQGAGEGGAIRGASTVPGARPSPPRRSGRGDSLARAARARRRAAITCVCIRMRVLRQSCVAAARARRVVYVCVCVRMCVCANVCVPACRVCVRVCAKGMTRRGGLGLGLL